MADTKRHSIGAKVTTQKTGPPSINELDAALSKAIGAKWVTGSTPIFPHESTVKEMLMHVLHQDSHHYHTPGPCS